MARTVGRTAGADRSPGVAGQGEYAPEGCSSGESGAPSILHSTLGSAASGADAAGGHATHALVASLGETAVRVWHLLDEETTVAGLARRLAAEGGIRACDAELRTAALMERLSAVGLVRLEPRKHTGSPRPARE